jgi:hypothetical protein
MEPLMRTWKRHFGDAEVSQDVGEARLHLFAVALADGVARWFDVGFGHPAALSAYVIEVTAEDVLFAQDCALLSRLEGVVYRLKEQHPERKIAISVFSALPVSKHTIARLVIGAG